MLRAKARAIVNIPDWLAHPNVCPVSVNVPELEAIPIVILPCIVMVLVAVPSGDVHTIAIVIEPPFTAELKLPLSVVPTPKH